MFEDLVSVALEEIIDAVNDTFAVSGRKAKAVIPVVVGPQPVWDIETVERGLLYGRVITAIPEVGNQRGVATPCGVLFWNVSVAIGVVRCISVVNDGGNAPSVREMTKDGLTMTADMADLMGTIIRQDNVKSFDSWVPLAAEGGASGGEALFTLRLGVQ